jgi:hypothetical protein
MENSYSRVIFHRKGDIIQIRCLIKSIENWEKRLFDIITNDE